MVGTNVTVQFPSNLRDYNQTPSNVSDFVENSYMAPKRAAPKVVRRTTVINNVAKKRTNRRVSGQRAVRSTPRAVFGPVTTIDSAPISIGNTFGGSAPVITQIPGGQRIKGRDFLMNIANTDATVTGWTLVAGSPITPVCMVSSGLRNMMQMYARYCVHGVAIHYVTACTTGDSGAVMLYFDKDRSAPGLNTNSANMLSVVLSDPNTVISPVWKNCSAVYGPAPQWLPTDVFNSDNLNEQSFGELFVYVRIPSNSIPGYILIDYDISFAEMQVNVKSLSLPVSRMKYSQVRLTNAVPVANLVATYSMVAGLLLDNSTPSAPPPGFELGDIYKILIDADDATAGTVTTAWNTIMPVGGGSVQIPNNSMRDGSTIYGVIVSTTQMSLYGSYYGACTQANPLITTAALQAGGAHSFTTFMSLVGGTAGVLTQSNI